MLTDFSKFQIMPLFFLIFFALISCSENLFYNESMPALSIEIAFYRNSEPFKMRTSDTLLAGDSVWLQAKIYPSQSYTPNYSWTVVSSVSSDTLMGTSRLEFPYKLGSAKGLYTFTFCAVDNLGDTLSKAATIIVSSKPVCEDNLSFKIFQGSPTFTWECQDENLSYNFKLIDSYRKRTMADTTLRENILQLGFALPGNFEVNLTATNSHGFKYEQKREWSRYE
jgi:hypothetical protein